MTDRLRGYALTKLRRRWAPRIEAGKITCPRCGQTIHPSQSWDLGHVEDIGTGGDPLGDVYPEHTACNRSAGARLGLQLRRHPRRRIERWTR